ncbi:MAG: BspA family leucine-rich repeat surface protein [Bacteriovoracia bacterium]
MSHVTNMSNMFQGATSANPNTSSWNTSSATWLVCLKVQLALTQICLTGLSQT